MLIGELSQQINMSRDTIRFYEKEGLLQKAVRNLENNYRDYDQHHLERLRFIRRCRSLGMTHEEIRTLLMAKNNPDGCHEINDLVDAFWFGQNVEQVQNRGHDVFVLGDDFVLL